MNTLIVSDIHLGSRNCRADQLALLLESDFDRLILNGDTVNSLNMKKFRPDHWKLLAQLRTIARERELILIRGNHEGFASEREVEFGELNVLATLLGVELQEQFRLEAGPRSYLVLHGDRFDPTLTWPIITDVAEWGYQTIQKLNKKGAKWLKHKVKRLGGVVEMVRRRSVEYARSQGYDGIIAGHTHFADDELIGDMHYLNSGCWTEYPCTYILADEQRVELCHWDGQERCTQPPLCQASMTAQDFAVRTDS
jgi:UDP-2,3-diacylglucosamine pyrophosphatase LpxH